MFCLRPITWILCLALAAGPLTAQDVASPAVQDYARREADSPGLDDFRGGFHVVVAAVFVVAVVTTAICLDLAACPTCSRRHYYYEELPPAYDRHGPVRP